MYASIYHFFLHLESFIHPNTVLNTSIPIVSLLCLSLYLIIVFAIANPKKGRNRKQIIQKRNGYGGLG